MEFKVRVGISNRHVHLTKEVYDKLFQVEMIKSKDLKQKDEFATEMFVTVKGPKGEIPHVRVLGPLRAYNQVEISHTDAFKLGINPPVRKSGDLEGSSPIIVYTDLGTVNLNQGCILAQNHIHMSLTDLENYHLKNDQEVMVMINKERKGAFVAHIKATLNGVKEFHIDRDEASAFCLENEEELIVHYE